MATQAAVLERRDSYGRILAVLTFTAIAAAVQQTALTPALPQIQQDLGISTTAVAWLLTIFVVSATVATPILGRLSDIYGRDRTMLVICVVVALGGLIGALGSSLAVLIVARALQGFGGAFYAIAFGILRDEAPVERRATGFGLVSSSYGVGGGIGFLASGPIVDHLGYSYIFWFGFLLFAIAAVAVWLFIPESPMKTPATIDWVGAGLLTGSLIAFLLGVSESVRWGWTSTPVLTLFAISVLVGAVWAVYELRQRAPLVDLRLFRTRGVWTMNATAGLTGFGMYMTLLLIPKFAQTPESAGYGFSASVTQAGLFLMPWTLAMMLAAASAGPLANRFGARSVLFVGSTAFTLSLLWFALLHGEVWQVLIGTAGLGVGIGLVHSSMANLLAQNVPHEQVGEAMAALSIGRTIGSAVGTQVAATILATLTIAGSSIPKESAYTVAYLFATVLGAAAFFCIYIAPNDRPARRRA